MRKGFDIKRRFYIIGHWCFVILLQMAFSCETDLNVMDSATYEKPFVYSILDPDDSIHYVRINRVFKSYDDPSNYFGKGDSIYYKNATVNLYFTDQHGIKFFEQQFLPQYFNKEDGLFNSDDHLLYSTGHDINPYFMEGCYVYLSIFIPETNVTAVGIQRVLDEPEIDYPKSGQKNYTYFFEPHPITIRWSTSSDFAKYYLDFLVYYRNFKNDENIGRDSISVTFRFSGANRSFSPTGDAFYSKLRLVMLEAPTVDYRKIDSIRLKLTAISSSFMNYIETSKIADDYSGIGYSNIENANGIFDIKYTDYLTPINLDQRSVDSLVDGRFTKQFHFVRW